jgi:class 3 adenylate cyclase/tetratricopeptide (TPR) repeat protein
MDVAAWLEGLGLGQYTELFAENRVDLDVLPDLTDADLNELGIPLGDRKRLRKAIDALGAEPGGATAPADTGKQDRQTRLIEGERKQVTVLFADIKGSTQLIEAMDPELAAKRMDPTVNAMKDAVRHHEGTVNKVMGDGIMALFGAPLAQEDHAVRACAAALDMQAAVAAMADLGVDIRVGLNSGEVIVRAIGNDMSMDYDATGTTVHLAARMEEMAAPGAILATAATARLAQGFIETQPLGARDVKGMSEPVEVHEIVGRGRVASRWDVMARRGLTRFVGRDSAMDELARACARAAGGSGQVVSVVGDAGNGKSRLVHEFVGSDATRGWAIRTASAAPDGADTPYLPLSGLLRSLFEIGDRDTPAVVAAKVERYVMELDAALRVVLPALHSVLDIPVNDVAWEILEPLERRHRIRDAFRALTMRRSQLMPLLLLFEDLHWLDAETQSVLDNLVDALSAARIMMIVTYRPEYRHQWSGKSFYSQIRVDPLSDASSDTLLSSLMGDNTGLQPVKRLIAERTAGTPLFMEETVRSLIESGALGGAPGDLRLSTDVDEVVIPASVHAVLASRIDRLAPEQKELLQTASVIGRGVPVALLDGLVETPADRIRTLLDDLQAAEFLFETRVVPNQEYSFKHALTQDVAYGGLLMERRRALHALLVGLIEDAHAERIEEHVERLAHHALMGEMWDKAVGYCRQAGSKAMQCSAHREAGQLLERFLGALAHLPHTRDNQAQAIDVRLELRAAYSATGDVEKMFAHLREARRLADAIDDPLRRAWADMFSMSVIESQRDLDWDAPRSIDKALGVASAAGDQPLLCMSTFVRGMASNQEGCFRETLAILVPHADDFAGPLRHDRFNTAATWSIISLSLVTVAETQLGEREAALAAARECQAIASESQRPFDLGIACWAEGSALLRLGDVDAALPVLERGLGLCQSENTRILHPVMAPWLAYALALSGRHEEAGALAEQAWRRLGPGNLFWMHIWAFAPIGWTFLELGLADEALIVAEHMGSYATTHCLDAVATEGLRIKSQALLRQGAGDSDAAEAYFRHAIDASEARGMQPEAAHSHAGLSKLLAACGRTDEADDHMSRARALFRAAGMADVLDYAHVEPVS